MSLKKVIIILFSIITTILPIYYFGVLNVLFFCLACGCIFFSIFLILLMSTVRFGCDIKGKVLDVNGIITIKWLLNLLCITLIRNENSDEVKAFFAGFKIYEKIDIHIKEKELKEPLPVLKSEPKIVDSRTTDSRTTDSRTTDSRTTDSLAIEPEEILKPFVEEQKNEPEDNKIFEKHDINENVVPLEPELEDLSEVKLLHSEELSEKKEFSFFVRTAMELIKSLNKILKSMNKLIFEKILPFWDYYIKIHEEIFFTLKKIFIMIKRFFKSLKSPGFEVELICGETDYPSELGQITALVSFISGLFPDNIKFYFQPDFQIKRREYNINGILGFSVFRFVVGLSFFIFNPRQILSFYRIYRHIKKFNQTFNDNKKKSDNRNVA